MLAAFVGMELRRSRQLLAFLLICTFIISVQLWRIPSGPATRTKTPSPTRPNQGTLKTQSQKPKPPVVPPRHLVKPEAELENGTSWTFEAARDARNYGLSYAQCNTAFSDLYKEIERAAAYRKEIGMVTPSDVSIHWVMDGSVRAMIYDQKLYVLDTNLPTSGLDSDRALATLHGLDRAIKGSAEPLPNIEFSFAVKDIADPDHTNKTIWALTRLSIDQEFWLMPDFGYWSWPSHLIGEYEQVRSEIRDIEIPWKEKIPKALWRGALGTNDVRPVLMKATEKKKWADVKEIHWANGTDMNPNAGGTALTIADHCLYQFLIQTEGRSYSGRGKYLLNCASITVVHKTEWFEPHLHLLVPSGPRQNFVEVERNFTDLGRKIESLLGDPEHAKLIVDNSVATFRDHYLTPAAQACYWRQLFWSWAEVSFEPERYEMVGGKKRGRGTPFESFAILPPPLQPPPPPRCTFWRKITFKCKKH